MLIEKMNYKRKKARKVIFFRKQSMTICYTKYCDDVLISKMMMQLKLSIKSYEYIKMLLKTKVIY